MGSRTKYWSVKRYKNPDQQSPQKAGIITRTPLSTKYKPVKWLLTRDWNSDQPDLLWLKRRQRSNSSTLRNSSPETLSPVPLPCGSEVDQKGGTGSTHKPALLELWGLYGVEENLWYLLSLEQKILHEPWSQCRSPRSRSPTRSRTSCLGEREFGRTRHCAGRGARKNFLAIEEEGQQRLAKVIL